MEGRVVCEIEVAEDVVVEVLRWVRVEVLRGANGAPLRMTNFSWFGAKRSSVHLKVDATVWV